MSFGQAIDELAKRWKSITIIGGALIVAVLWVAGMQAQVAANDKKSSQNSESIKLLTIMVNRIDATMALMLQMGGYTADQIKAFRTIPTAPVIDSVTKKPAVGAEWIEPKLFPALGRLYRAVEDSVGYRIEEFDLWDLRDK